MKDQEYDYFYDDEQDAKYCYPGTNVLKNKLDIRDKEEMVAASVRSANASNDMLEKLISSCLVEHQQ